MFLNFIKKIINLFSISKESIAPIIRTNVNGSLFTVDIAIGKKVFGSAMKCVLYEEEKRIVIGDIYICDYASSQEKYLPYVNKGYGSLLMNELLCFAKEKGYKRIEGSLVEVDENTNYDPTHRERQIHFYKKFGFKILPSEEKLKNILLVLEPTAAKDDGAKGV